MLAYDTELQAFFGQTGGSADTSARRDKMTHRSTKSGSDSDKTIEDSPASREKTLTVEDALTIVRKECDGHYDPLLQHKPAKCEMVRHNRGSQK